MKLSKIILYIMAFAIFLSGCQGIKETLSNKKKTNSNEFLVKKKAPLILPPDYKKLPLPQDQDLDSEKSSYDKKIDLSKVLNKKSKSKIKNKNNSLEKSISKILNKN